MQEIDFHRALHRPGTIVDAGAHDGRLTLPLSALPNTHVIAFEPLPTVFSKLKRKIENIGALVTVRPEALSDRAGSFVLSVPTVGGVDQEEWASLAKDYEALRRDDPRIDAVRDYTVPTLTLDSLNLTDVTAMKIDVEGAEQEMLTGALSTLRRCRPILSIEIEERHRAGSTQAVPALLRHLDYVGFFEFYGDWRPIETLDIETMQKASPSPAVFEVSDPYVFCFYFVPPERIADLAVLARLP